MPYPTDRKYTKEHEWIKVDGANATVGITDYAQESLGDIVFVDLPKVGAEITAAKTFGTIAGGDPDRSTAVRACWIWSACIMRLCARSSPGITR